MAAFSEQTIFSLTVSEDDIDTNGWPTGKFLDSSFTYDFAPDGTFTYVGKKGSWFGDSLSGTYTASGAVTKGEITAKTESGGVFIMAMVDKELEESDKDTMDVFWWTVAGGNTKRKHPHGPEHGSKLTCTMGGTLKCAGDDQTGSEKVLVSPMASTRAGGYQTGSEAQRALVSPHQYSSTVIAASAEAVFELVKTCHFKWMKTVSKAEASGEDTVSICYADNTIQQIRKLEYSSLEMKVTWEVIESEPAAPVFSAVHSITCSRVTSTNQCFVAWNTDFSSDATPEIIEDSKWKKDDAFNQLMSFLGA